MVQDFSVWPFALSRHSSQPGDRERRRAVARWQNVASRCRRAIGKLAILTFPMLTATVVRAFTNPRLGKIEFVNVVADCAQQSRFPFRRTTKR
jgi:hypothetical protein